MKVKEQLIQEIERSPGFIVDDDLRDNRGVLAVKHESKVIFSEPVEIETSKLPRWKPYIIIDRSMITED